MLTHDVLIYFVSQAEALTEFLLPMLEYVPAQRATAAEMLAHPWLQGAAQPAAAAAEPAVAEPASAAAAEPAADADGIDASSRRASRY